MPVLLRGDVYALYVISITNWSTSMLNNVTKERGFTDKAIENLINFKQYACSNMKFVKCIPVRFRDDEQPATTNVKRITLEHYTKE